VRRGDAHLGEALELQGLVEAAHGGEQCDDEVGHDGGAEDLVPGEEERDVGACGDVGGEVVADPAARGVEARGPVGEGRERRVGDGNGDGDGGGVGGEGFEEGRVGVEELDAVGGGLGGEEGGHGGRGREVVGVGAVVHADGERREALRRRRARGGGGGEQEEEEREHRDACLAYPPATGKAGLDLGLGLGEEATSGAVASLVLKPLPPPRLVQRGWWGGSRRGGIDRCWSFACSYV